MINGKTRFISMMFALVFCTTVSQAQKSISVAEAREHVGQIVTVCGHVASTHYSERSRGAPTFINLDKPYPNQIFTVLIWGSDRPKFGAPETIYNSQSICVTGKITLYRGVPETVVHEPPQIRISKER